MYRVYSMWCKGAYSGTGHEKYDADALDVAMDGSCLHFPTILHNWTEHIQ